MFNVCTACGLLHEEYIFDESGSLVCATCGDRRPFRLLPLLITTTPPVTLIDTTRATVEETAARVASWIRAHTAGTA